MTKRQRAMVTSLAMWRFARQMDRMKENSELFGMQLYTFWSLSGRKDYKTTDEIRKHAKMIARSAR